MKSNLKKIERNGVTYLVERFDDVMESVQISLTFRVGSIHDGDRPGISHFLEHMMFKANACYDTKTLTTLLSRFTVAPNGFTDIESTTYLFEVLSDSKSIKRGLNLYLSMLTLASLLEEEVEQERPIIASECESWFDDDYSKLIHSATTDMFAGTTASLLPIGTAESIAIINRDDLIKHYKKYYTSDNMIVSIVGGNFDFELIAGMIDVAFQTKPIDYPKLHVTDTYKNIITAFDKNLKVREDNTLIYSMYDASMTHIMLFKPVDESTETQKYTRLLMNIIGEGFDSRMFRIIRIENSLSYNNWATDDYTVGYGKINMYIETEHGNLESAKSLLLELVGDISKNGITMEEYQSVRKKLRSALICANKNLSNRHLKNMRRFLYTDDINKVTQQDVLDDYLSVEFDELNQWIKNNFDPNSFALAILTQF